MVYGREALTHIETINVGDSVFSYNLDKERIELSRVVNVLKRKTVSIYELSMGKARVFVTAEHPFYVLRQGWVTVKDLKPGDSLKTFTGETLRVDTAKAIHREVEVYNIEVDGNHNYFVTDSRVLVHNKNITKLKRRQENKLKQNFKSKNK